MTTPATITWRLLIVEDTKQAAADLIDVVPQFVDAPDKVDADVCDNFKQAVTRLQTDRYDLIILDLKDDSDAWAPAVDAPAGLQVFEKLQQLRFVPVVFYTALAHKVRSYETPFVRVVDKPEGTKKVVEEVRRVFTTKLPSLARHIDEIQRSYMWDFVNSHWKQFDTTHEQADLAYLLARRLALTLEKEARKFAKTITGTSAAMPDPRNVHPMEMHIPPPPPTCRQAGDILKDLVDKEVTYWVTLTPSCDFEQPGRLDHVLLARCLPLSSQPEYAAWVKDPAPNVGLLKALLGDNRQGGQSERFKFLPGTFFFPDSVVDFQLLRTVAPEAIKQMGPVASLESPFAEALLARFSRYFGRLGTADIDKTVVLNRIQSGIKNPRDTTLGQSQIPSRATAAAPNDNQITPAPTPAVATPCREFPIATVEPALSHFIDMAQPHGQASTTSPTPANQREDGTAQAPQTVQSCPSDSLRGGTR